jgi:hypothetical protein
MGMSDFFILLSIAAVGALCYALWAWEKADDERLRERSRRRGESRGRAFDKLIEGKIDEDTFNKMDDAAKRIR